MCGALDGVLADRQAGILLHPTSLPGPFGVGDLGPEARMNDPASCVRPRAERRHWQWRLLPGAAEARSAARPRFLSSLYGRA